MENENTTIKNPNKNKPGIILRIISLVLIIEGIVGSLFFLTINIIQFFDPVLFNDLTQNFGFVKLNFYCWSQLLFHISLIVGGIFLLKLRKAGFYLILTTLICIVTIDILLENIAVIVNGIIALIILITLYFYRNNLR